MGNLKSHRNRSTHGSCSTVGCACQLKSWAAGNVVPPSIVKTHAKDKAPLKKSAGPLDIFVTATKGSKFDNLTFNHGMCGWLLRSDLPW